MKKKEKEGASKVVMLAIDLLKEAKQCSDTRWFVFLALDLATSMAWAEIKTLSEEDK